MREGRCLADFRGFSTLASQTMTTEGRRQQFDASKLRSGPKLKVNHNPGTAADMVAEVSAAAGFVSRLLKARGLLSEYQLRLFSDGLRQALSEHYQHHWFPDRPQKGSGYRCIRINHEMDPIIGKAACRIGLTSELMFSLLPRELTLWVDPFEVSYRIGEDGSICVLYEAPAHANSSASSSGSSGAAFDYSQNCKAGGRMSPPKNYLMTVSS
ncbi:protein BTG2 [Denticeps clupeoides]|uniref:Anti-proliferative protein domain-containing protein n=1 Tax=Denticeps clupeoides TaxID=299321 RepID=A0AAY4C780_9TELE|nr:protein BTG2-like [Denticeps clupeoides]